MSVPAVLVRKSTKQIIKEDVYPRLDMQPVQGLDPDYEWLVKHIPFAEPPYDSRIYVMATNLPDLEFLEDFEEHPSFTGLREYRITYTPERRSDAEIIISIENAKSEANSLINSEATHKDEFALMMSAVSKKSQGQLLNNEEQSQIDKLELMSVALAKNGDNASNKILQVASGQTPNIDEGWEKSL